MLSCSWPQIALQNSRRLVSIRSRPKTPIYSFKGTERELWTRVLLGGPTQRTLPGQEQRKTCSRALWSVLGCSQLVESEATLTQTTCSALEQRLTLSELRRPTGRVGYHRCILVSSSISSQIFFLAQMSTLMFGAELSQLLLPLHFISLSCHMQQWWSTLATPQTIWLLPRSSVHGISQERVLEWVAISFSTM